MIIRMPGGLEGVIPFTFEEFCLMCEMSYRGASIRVLATGQDGTHLFMSVLDIELAPPAHDTMPSVGMEHDTDPDDLTVQGTACISAFPTKGGEDEGPNDAG